MNRAPTFGPNRAPTSWLLALTSLILAQADGAPRLDELFMDFEDPHEWEASFHLGPDGPREDDRVSVDIFRGAKIEVDFRGAPEGSYACVGLPKACGERWREAFQIDTELSFVVEIEYRNRTAGAQLSLAWQRESRGKGLGEKLLPYSAERKAVVFDLYDPSLNDGRPCERISGLHLHMRPNRLAGIERVDVDRILIRPPSRFDADALVQDFRDRAKDATVASRRLPEDQARIVGNRVEELRRSIDGFTRRMNMPSRLPASGVQEYRKRFEAQLVSIEAALSAGGIAQIVAEEGGDMGFTLHAVSPLVQVFREQPPPGEPFAGAELSAAKGEYECAQVLIAAGAKALEEVRVSISDLMGERGSRIPAAAIQLFRVGYVHITQSTPGGGAAGWWPDPLFPNVPFSVEAQTVQPLLIEVLVPRTAAPGVYRGEVTVTPAGGPEGRLPLNLTVYSFELPRQRRLKTALSACTMLENYVSGFDDFYPLERYPREPLLKRFYSFMLEHGVAPSRVGLRHAKITGEGEAATIDFTEAEEYIRYCVDRGLDLIDIYGQGIGRPYGEPYVKQWTDFLRAKGWADLAFAYVQDEPPAEALPEVAARAQQIGRAAPGLPRMCTVPPTGSLMGDIDIWCPLTPHVTREQIAERHAAGERVWWYVCIAPKRPAANLFIDYPATDQRVLFWQSFGYGVDGFLYYAIDAWQIHARNHPASLPDFVAAAEGKAWGLPHWNPLTWGDGNGDGLLMYPGPDGPWASRRLKTIRDGIEDFEYLALLRDLTAELKRLAARGSQDAFISRCERILQVSPSVVRDVETFTEDPSSIVTARAEVAAAIEQAQQKIDGLL